MIPLPKSDASVDTSKVHSSTIVGHIRVVHWGASKDSIKLKFDNAVNDRVTRRLSRGDL